MQLPPPSYTKGKLQARIDVPLSEAAKINLGQMVEITSSILPEKVFGEEYPEFLEKLTCKEILCR